MIEYKYLILSKEASDFIQLHMGEYQDMNDAFGAAQELLKRTKNNQLIVIMRKENGKVTKEKKVVFSKDIKNNVIWL